jgi:GH25 family lysozyme M1 (1,4-beta-N-acetylmuramidase)
MSQTTKKRPPARKKKRRQRRRGCLGGVLLLAAVLAGILLLRPSAQPAANPLSPGDFRTVDGYVTCTAVPTRRGIDVSEHQDEIDWEQVRDAGFDFAFIRIGYRGYSIGWIHADERARENLANAKAAGLDVGVYFYAQAVNVQEAAEEAAWCLDFLQDEKLDLPVVYDWEWAGSDKRTGSMDRETVTACFQTFCTAIEEGGYQAMIYFDSHISRDLLDLEELAEYPFWLAQYKDQMDYPHRVDVWQYTETGTIPGIEGDVDIDLMFLYE